MLKTIATVSLIALFVAPTTVVQKQKPVTHSRLSTTTLGKQLMNPAQPLVSPPQPLRASSGIKLGAIAYIRGETIPIFNLERAIQRELPEYNSRQRKPDAPLLRYYYNRVDLNGDGIPEVLVYLVGSETCGSGGCTLLIFKPTGQDYQLVSRITLVNTPILVTSQKTNGWNDLVMYVAGGGAQGRYALMQFNGKTYPSNPSVQPAVPPNSTLNGQALISDEINPNTGIQLQPASPKS